MNGIAYKIVQNFYGELKSVCTYHVNDSIRVTYTPHIRIYPNLKGSKLFVCKDLEFAHNLNGRIGGPGFEIWKCYCYDLEPCKSMTKESFIREYWESNRKDHVNDYYIQNFASLECSSVILLEREES